MNVFDMIIVAVIALILIGAVVLTVRRKKRGGCSCGCSDCTLCDKYKNEKDN